MGSAIVWTGLFAPDFHLPKPLTLRACEVRTKTQYYHVLVSLLPLQGNADAADQSSTIEGLGKEANCPSLRRSRADGLVGEGRDENDWHAVSPAEQDKNRRLRFGDV